MSTVVYTRTVRKANADKGWNHKQETNKEYSTKMNKASRKNRRYAYCKKKKVFACRAKGTKISWSDYEKDGEINSNSKIEVITGCEPKN